MEFLTKEKSKQIRKGVNNQNNSASYFRLCNTDLHHHSIKKSIKKRPLVVLWKGSTSVNTPWMEKDGGSTMYLSNASGGILIMKISIRNHPRIERSCMGKSSGIVK